MADVYKNFTLEMTTANIVSNTTGTAWRLGTMRFDIQPDGRR